MVRGVRSLSRPPFAVRFVYYATGWWPDRWTAWAETFVLSDAWPLVSTARFIVVYVLTLRVVGSQRYSWETLVFVASVMLLPGLLATDRDVQRRREIARLRGMLPRPMPVLVFGSIVLLGIFVLRSGIVVDEHARRILNDMVLSSFATMIIWQVIRARRHQRLLPPLPARPVLFADR